MRKKKSLRLILFTIACMCLLTIACTFQTICVKTLSENYLDALTINQIIDLVIDQDENINFKQLQQLQKDLKNNKELYRFNCYAFDYSIRHIDQEHIQLSNDKINTFSKSCYTIIKDNHETNIKVSHISKIIKQNSFWKRLNHNMKKKMQSFSKLFVLLYTIVESFFFKLILVLCILVCLLKLYGRNQKMFSFYLTMIFIVKSLIDYLMIFIIELSKSFYIKMLNIPLEHISTNSYLVVATTCLMIGMILVGTHIYKAD